MKLTSWAWCTLGNLVSISCMYCTFFPCSACICILWTHWLICWWLTLHLFGEEEKQQSIYFTKTLYLTVCIPNVMATLSELFPDWTPQPTWMIFPNSQYLVPSAGKAEWQQSQIFQNALQLVASCFFSSTLLSVVFSQKFAFGNFLSTSEHSWLNNGLWHMVLVYPILTNAVFKKNLFFKLVLVSCPENLLARKKSEDGGNCLKIRAGGIWLAEETINSPLHCPGEPFTPVYSNSDSLLNSVRSGW